MATGTLAQRAKMDIGRGPVAQWIEQGTPKPQTNHKGANTVRTRVSAFGRKPLGCVVL